MLIIMRIKAQKYAHKLYMGNADYVTIWLIAILYSDTVNLPVCRTSRHKNQALISILFKLEMTLVLICSRLREELANQKIH